MSQREKSTYQWERNWVTNLRPLLRDPTYKRAFQWTLKSGCDPEPILELLAVCTHHTKQNESELSRIIKERIKERRGRFEKLQKQIGLVQETLEALHSDSAVAQFPALSVELPKALSFADECLSSLIWASDLRLNPLPRDFALLAFCLSVQRVTNSTSDESFRKLADLLQAGHQAHGRRRTIDADSLARRVRRFRKKRPEIAEALSRFLLSGH